MDYAGEAAMRPGLNAGMSEQASWSEPAFESVFFEYYARIVAVLDRITGDRAQSEELASETFLRLYRQPCSPEEYQNVSGWLYRTATRLALDSLRAQGRSRRHDPAVGERLAESATPANPLDEVLRRERAGQVRRALAAVKPVYAEALMLRSSGLSYKEVAAALDIQVTSVGRLLARAEEAFEKAFRRGERSRFRRFLPGLR